MAILRRINHWLDVRVGYRVVRSLVRGLPGEVVEDPRLAGYYDPGLGNGCTILAPPEVGLGFNAFALGPGSYHPWIIAARAAEFGGEGKPIAHLLRTYYSIVKPASLRDWLDIPESASPKLDSLPLHAWSILPWTTRSPDEAIRAIEIAQLKENRLHGLEEGMSAGAKAFGPVSDDKLRVEGERIVSLFEAIRTRGLDHNRSDYNLRATFLVADHNWSWLSMGGMHRVAMAAACGITRIPVRVAAVVRRNEVDIWPQVVSGLYDRDTALCLFDRLIERRPPKCVLPWLEWVDSNRSQLGTA